MVLVDGFLSDEMEPYTLNLIKSGKVCCDQRGNPTMAYVNRHWIVKADIWHIDNLDVMALINLRRLFKLFGLGVAPTPSSLGRRTMLYVWDRNHLKHHTALSRYAEEFLFQHGFGSVVYNNGYVGRTIDVADLLDMHFAFLSEYGIGPGGTAEAFEEGCELYYPVYFAHCIVRVNRELPMGLFPCRNKRHQVVYPTLPGVYHTYLWSNQIELLRENGCDVKTLEGFGWQRFIGDNRYWVDYITHKVNNAPNDKVYKMGKGVAVSGIGSQGMHREHHILRTEFDYDRETDWPVVLAHSPIDLWVHPVRDELAAPMVHWQRAVVAKVAERVQRFALDFAWSGRLVSIDHDAIMVTGSDDYGNRVVRKYSLDHAALPTGTWVAETHHEVHFWGVRAWTSSEAPHRYGRNIERYTRNGVFA